MSDAIPRLNAALEGRYVIEHELGEGGMATVYLADDLKHERKVALKVLKPELAAVVGAERFLAEIKTTANLTHPHILPLFDSGEADGFLFYVMPYVEGETLRDRIDREKQLPVDEAVALASKVAGALQHAHEHGVIHRDIKPGNILLQDGEPVVADFGIALAVGAAGSNRLTETGLSLGTPYYMSPEQATGDQAVGASTDTYALGSVLYEMLVGDPPYPGSTAQAVLGKIIAGKPVSATEQRPSIPASVDAAVRKALEKLPADRFTSAQDFVRALGDEHFRYGELVAGVAGADSGPWKRLAVGFAALAGLFGLGFGWSLLRPEAPPPVTRSTLTLPPEVSVVGAGRGLAVSPDGRTLVFADVPGQLYQRDLRGLDPVPIPGTDDAWYPFFSPDGEWVGYFDQAEGTLKKIRLDGGLGQTLAPAAGAIRSAGWGPDGTIVFYTNQRDGLWRVPDTGGEVEQVANTEGPQLRWLDMLPDGRAVVAHETNPPSDDRVVAVSLETGERTLLSPGRTPKYVTTGHVVFWRDEGLWAVPFDADRLEATGDPVPIVEGVAVATNGLANFAVGGDLVFYRAGGATAERVPVWVGRDGSAEVLDPALSGSFGAPAISPDGRMIALEFNTPPEGTQDIWIYDLDQETFSRLTFEGDLNRYPFWSPDGREVGFSSDRDGLPALYSRPADLSSETRLLLADADDAVTEGTWTPDGRWLVHRWGSILTNLTEDLRYAAPDSDDAAVVILETPAIERNPSLSPDGRWLAYTSDESGQPEVYVRPFPGPGGRSQVSTDVAINPVWAHNGREIFYLSLSGSFQLVVATVRTEPDFAVESRQELFNLEAYTVLPFHPEWDVSTDDQRILLLGPSQIASEGRYVVVQNFAEELRRLAPN